MRRLPLLALCLVGCATTVTAPKTSPLLDVSARGLPPLPTKSAIVLSAATFQQVSPDLSFNSCLSSTNDASKSAGASAACPPARIADLAAVTNQVEKLLFEAGWEPINQAGASKLITSNRVAVALRDLLSRGQASLLEASLQVGLASTADLIIVVSDWKPTFGTRSVAEGGGYKLCPVNGELGMEAYGRTGKLIWRGSVAVQATDTLDVTMTGSEVSPKGYACATKQSCLDCAASQNVMPSAEAVQALVPRATATLVKELLARQ
ncbi:MAG TPA: hypothetical protein VGK67_33635 [Myxococcales bacterium]